MDLEGLDLLSDEECRVLLRQGRVGRVVVSLGAVPVVFPVNYMMAGDEILFFTAEGTKRRAAIAKAMVTFEVDYVDAFAEAGWSVIAVGQAREQTEPSVVDGARRAGLRSWAPGDRFHLIVVTIDFVSGRRIHAATDRPDQPAGSGELLVGPHSPVGAVAQVPVRVGHDWTLQGAANAMREANVSAVLVGSDQAIVTERELTRALNAGLGPRDLVTAIAVTPLIFVNEDSTVVQAATYMLRHEIRHLLVRNWRGVVTGVVSLRAVLGVLVDAMDPAVWVELRQTLVTKAGAPSP